MAVAVAGTVVAVAFAGTAVIVLPAGAAFLSTGASVLVVPVAAAFAWAKTFRPDKVKARIAIAITLTNFFIFFSSGFS